MTTTTVPGLHLLLFLYSVLLWSDDVCSHLYHAGCQPGNGGSNRHSQPLCWSVIGVWPYGLMSLGVTQNLLSLHCNYAFLAALFQESMGMGCRRFVSRVWIQHVHHIIRLHYTKPSLYYGATISNADHFPPPPPPPLSSSFSCSTGFFMPESAIPWPWKVKNQKFPPPTPRVPFLLVWWVV